MTTGTPVRRQRHLTARLSGSTLPSLYTNVASLLRWASVAAGLAVFFAPTTSYAGPRGHVVLGATATATGTTFSVWAPGVDAVSVEVPGPGRRTTSLTRAPVASGDDDVWSGAMPGLKAGSRYRFEITRNGATAPTIDPRSEQISRDKSGQWSVVSGSASAIPKFDEPPFNKMVIYELHVGTFHRGTASGAYDFSGTREQLGYLEKLGVDAIELLPIIANDPGRGHVPADYDWGYDPVSLFAVNSSYGDPKSLRALVRDSHRHHIAVILDVVYNHLVASNLLMRFGGFTLPSIPNGVYFYGDERGDTGFGPRPDYGRPQVRQYIEDNALLWLRSYGIDGLRWDSTVNIRAYHDGHAAIPEGRQVMRETNDSYRNTDPKQPGKIAIAEDLRAAWDVITPTAQGGLGFNSQWDDDFCYALRAATASPTDEGRDVKRLGGAVGGKYGDDEFHRVIYSENHDKVGHPGEPAQGLPQIRLPRLIDGADPEGYFAKKRSTLAAAVLLTSPGIPMLFQGQEMLDTNTFDFGRATPVDWTRPQRFPGIEQMYHDLIALRENRSGTTGGLTEQNVNVFHADPGDHTLAYHRYGNGGAGDDVVVVLNFSNRRIDALKIGFPRAGAWHVRFNSGAPVYDPSFTSGDSSDSTASPDGVDNLPFSATVGIGPYSAVILSQ